MSLICGSIVPFTLKHMTQVASAIRTHDLRALHAERAIRMALYGAGDVVKVCRPAAAGLNL